MAKPQVISRIFMKMKKPRLMTSNINKLAEFRRLGLDADMAAPSADLDEPDADPHFVCAHKAHSCGEGALCEDTRLDIDGSDVGIYIRFSQDKLEGLIGSRATFACCLALCQKNQVLVWEGSIDGYIGPAHTEGGFGFDPYFYPANGNGKSLAELEASGKKDKFSARAMVCHAFLSEPPIASFSRFDLESFNGPWQHESVSKSKISPS